LQALRCGVLKEALAAIDQDSQKSPEVLERIYQRRREITPEQRLRPYPAEAMEAGQR